MRVRLLLGVVAVVVGTVAAAGGNWWTAAGMACLLVSQACTEWDVRRRERARAAGTQEPAAP